MANWMGGSCPAMANQIAGGFCSVTAATLRGFLPGDLTAHVTVDHLARMAADEPARGQPAHDLYAGLAVRDVAEVGANQRASASCAARSARTGATRNRNGAASMVMTAAAMNTWYISSPIRPLTMPARARTKENSPICARARPVSTAVRRG